MAKGVLQYRELAKYYDVLYSWKDYGRESREILRLIEKHGRSKGRALLDAGCGTGRHIQHLMAKFDCVGLDSSEEMLQQARNNAKGVEFVREDMTSFYLGREFDVILCLFSAIGYVKTYPKLARTLRNFARHLRPGGVLIIEPWFTRSTFQDDHIHIMAQGTEDVKIARVDYSKIVGELSVVEEMIVVAEKGKGITTYRDRMVMGLFERDKFLELMRKAGLRARYLTESLAPGRGLYVGTKGTETRRTR